MCPDKELISAWHDGETDGRWMSEISMHMDDCSECRSEAEKLSNLSSYIGRFSVPNEDVIKQRMYEAIERKQSVVYPENFWRRHVNISLPVILSAAALVLVLCAVMVTGFQRFSAAPAVVEEITPEPELTLQVISLEDASAFLLSDDTGFDVLITIPSSDALSVTGEPQLLREADYRRSQ